MILFSLSSSRSKPESAKQPASRSGGCRVCLKSFKDGDYSRVCFGCKFKVCEDCATSYTKIDENQDEVSAKHRARDFARQSVGGKKNRCRFLFRKRVYALGRIRRGKKVPSIAKQSVPIHYPRSIQNSRRSARFVFLPFWHADLSRSQWPQIQSCGNRSSEVEGAKRQKKKIKTRVKRVQKTVSFIFDPFRLVSKKLFS